MGPDVNKPTRKRYLQDNRKLNTVWVLDNIKKLLQILGDVIVVSLCFLKHLSVSDLCEKVFVSELAVRRGFSKAREINGKSLAVQWLGLCTCIVGSIPGQGAKIPQASW